MNMYLYCSMCLGLCDNVAFYLSEVYPNNPVFPLDQ
jgi:hypothetical protein